MEVFQSLIVPSSFPMCFLTYSYLHFSLLWCSVGTCFFITVSVKLWMLFLFPYLVQCCLQWVLICICFVLLHSVYLYLQSLYFEPLHSWFLQLITLLFRFASRWFSHFPSPVCFLTFSQLHFPRLLCLVAVWFCAYVFCQSRTVSLAVTSPMSLTVGVTMHVICILASCLLVIATAKPLATAVCNILIPTFYIYWMNKSEILINLAL